VLNKRKSTVNKHEQLTLGFSAVGKFIPPVLVLRKPHASHHPPPQTPPAAVITTGKDPSIKNKFPKAQILVLGDNSSRRRLMV